MLQEEGEAVLETRSDDNRALQTEYPFTLPRGYVDERGNLHRQGVMRLAVALDEIHPLRDGRVQRNPAYVAIVLLSRVVTRLGNISPVPPAVVERLFAADLAFLQDLYMRMNEPGGELAETQCPDCGVCFAVDLLASAA
jgi:hypothetical protein